MTSGLVYSTSLSTSTVLPTPEADEAGSAIAAAAVDGGLDVDLLPFRLLLPLVIDLPRPVETLVASARSDSPPLGGAVDVRLFTDSSSSPLSPSRLASINLGSSTCGIGPLKSRPVSRPSKSKSKKGVSRTVYAFQRAISP